MDNAAFKEGYGDSVSIAAGTYPWHKQDVNTAAVFAALMTVAYPPDSPECAAVRSVSEQVVAKLDWLQANGHPKWGQVDVELPVAEQTRSGCSAS